MSVKNALETSITFTSNIIDIPNVNTFANIIDTEKTVITKGVFPVEISHDIEPIQIKLVLKPGRFVKIDGSSELPPIIISNLPNAEALAYHFIESESSKISNFIKKIEDTISPTATYDQKKNIYNGYITFENLPVDAVKVLDTYRVQNSGYDNSIALKDIIDTRIIFSKGTFPSGPGQPIPPIIVELKLNKASRLQKDGKYYKILPIEIKFDGILS